MGITDGQTKVKGVDKGRISFDAYELKEEAERLAKRDGRTSIAIICRKALKAYLASNKA